MTTDRKPTENEGALNRSIRRHIIVGLCLVFGLFGGLGAWSAVTEIAGAVVAPGLVAVESSAKKVQHQEGGIIARLNVQEGDRVEAGMVVVRLDDTQLKASLAIISKNLSELLATEARLLAERDELDSVSFPQALIAEAANNSDARASMAGQQTIFEARRAARISARNQLAEQIAQLEAGIGGLQTQRDAREKELQFIDTELEGLRDLFSRKLVSIQRVNALERDRARIDGDRGKLIADIATSRGTISEKRIQMLRVDDDFRSTVVRELADGRAKINENVERRIAAEDKLARIDVRAPVSGRVHQLTVFTVGGVISAGEAIMLIVPEKDRLIVDAQVEPQDIEHLYIGQTANVHFSGFADRNLKESVGEVTVISPDLIDEPGTHRKYYKIRLTVAPPVRLDGEPVILVPGMPAECYLSKGNRTVLSYLVKPIRDQLRRVWRE